MTVETTASLTTYTYTGPGDYAFTFPVTAEEDLVVTHVAVDGTATVGTLSTDYTITLVNDGQDGGTVTTVNPTDTTGRLQIQRVLPFEQKTAWENQGHLDLGILERDFDRVIMLLQQMNAIVLGEDATFMWRGTWATGYGYTPGQVATGPDYNVYLCLVAHSATVFLDDLADGYWQLIIDTVSLSNNASDTFKVKETDENSSEVYVGSLGYAKTASATFTEIFVPTQSQGDDSTAAASTAYVDAAVGAVEVTKGVLLVQDQKTAGTNGGTSSSGNNIRVLNTAVENSITGASLASNRITLPAGKYKITAAATAADDTAFNHKIRLYNYSESTYAAEGLGVYASTGNKSSQATLDTVLTLADEKVFELHHYIQGAFTTYGLGYALSQGAEVYASVRVEEV
jgi:hypothetical protein